MSKTYEKPPPDVLALLDKVKADCHPDLMAAGVTFGVLMVHPNLNKEGIATAPALKVKGQDYPALAEISINEPKNRLLGMADVKLLINAPAWDDEEPEGREACLDHELEHITVVEDEPMEIEEPVEGQPDQFRKVIRKQYRVDDNGLVVLRGREHDVYVGGFRSVIHRRGRHAIEARVIGGYAREFRQTLFAWADDMAGVPEGEVTHGGVGL